MPTGFSRYVPSMLRFKSFLMMLNHCESKIHFDVICFFGDLVDFKVDGIRNLQIIFYIVSHRLSPI